MHLHSPVTDQTDATFDLDTGILCLDFSNTLDGRLDPQPQEKLTDYAALLTFAVEAGILDTSEVQELEQRSTQEQSGAAATVQRAIDLREAIFRIFMAIAGDQTPGKTDLEVLNRTLASALPHGGIALRADGENEFEWVWESGSNLERPLWPIARSAADLLLGNVGDLGRVRECAANNCAWLFLDTTRNRSRRWCSMQSCGNRAKVQEFRDRRKGAERNDD